MKIDSKMINMGPSTYYEKDFLDILESHLVSISSRTDTVIVSVESLDAAVYTGDLYGYLTKLNVPMNLHWVTMRLSGMYNTNQFGPNNVNILIPSESAIDKIRQSYSVVSNSIGI